MPDVGVPELLIIACIVVLLFGPGKAADLGGALGKSIREFRKAAHEEDGASASTTPRSSITLSGAPSHGGSSGANSVSGGYCTSCGKPIQPSDKSCVCCAPRLATPGPSA